MSRGAAALLRHRHRRDGTRFHPHFFRPQQKTPRTCEGLLNTGLTSTYCCGVLFGATLDSCCIGADCRCDGCAP